MTESDQGSPRRGTGGVAARASGPSTDASAAAPAAAPGDAAAKAPARQRRTPGGSRPRAALAGGGAQELVADGGPDRNGTAERSADRTRTSPRPADGRTARTATAAKGAPKRKPRKARLRLVQVDAWSVMKTAFLLSIAIGIVSVVAVAIVWTVLGAAGVWDSLNNTVQTVMGNDFQIQDYIGTGRVIGFTMLVAVVDVVLLTAIATLGAFLYNLSATLLGGVEVTLAEDQ